MVADIHDVGPTTAPRPIVYIAHAQFPVNTMWVAVRTSGDPAAVTPFLRETLAALDPDLPMFQVQTLEQIARAALAQPRLLTLLLAVFAAAAMLLAGLGLYGVLAHAVGQRTREIGIRVALGARRGDVVRLVVGRAGRLGALGIAAGLPAAAAASRLLRGLLFGVEPLDAATYGAVAALVAGVALVAALAPAARAAAVDPVAALRQE